MRPPSTGRRRLSHAAVSAPRPANDNELDEAIDLIIDQQVRLDRNIPSLGDTRSGVIAELHDLDPPWTETLRVVFDGSDLIGVVLVDWDIATRRAWIHGPWISTDEARWPDLDASLLAAATSQLPDVIGNTIMTATVENRRLAALAKRVGWSAGEVNHVVIVDRSTIEQWPGSTQARDRIRPITDEDVTALGPLHDAEFPDTYYSAVELAARAARGEQTVLIAHDGNTGIDGYVAGQIQPDGDGYIDFLAIAPDARRRGLGRELLSELCRQLIPETTTQRACLTVQDGRSTARAFYESLGFRPDVSIVGYSAPAETADASSSSHE